MRAWWMTVRRKCQTWMQRRADRRIVRARLDQIERELRDYEASRILAAFVPKVA